MTPIDILHAVTALMTVVAAVLALARLGMGPTLLDRAVANDVLTASGVSLVAVMIVWWQRFDLGVLLVVLALTSFLTSVVIARHSVRENRASRRILTPAEAARQKAEREQAARAAEEQEHEAAEEAARTADGEALEGPPPEDADEGATAPAPADTPGERGAVLVEGDPQSGEVPR